MDGVWFQSVERKYGMDEAMHHDREAWRVFNYFAFTYLLMSAKRHLSCRYAHKKNVQTFDNWFTRFR
ncbi:MULTISPECIES: DUF6125 family protein [Bacteroides]|jgi:hypothetical protein|uniref:Uncharacterized protein n=1 Tax=Bacteroides intestinalis TaxID=329854 RepID=A0A6N2TRK7_9BACE|nr:MULTISPECIES: DUF6125 family protein [Bacteroides]